MIGIDTNVLVRYLTQDDAAQAARATRFMEAELGPAQQGSISVVVLVELCWVLQSLYRVTTSELLDLIDDLLRSRHLQLEHRPAVQAAVHALRQSPKASAGIADVLITHIGQALGCSHTVSFDKGAVRWAGMTLLDLDAP
ncbi:MAG: PIN domain-containing protein [Betaproteobacteria bacterium]|nr:PIN domain-containing protein [Betaproteobacteria bacterium]